MGRQPITWGVNYFWPVLDLFGPFSPAAVDRDYKPGVDAVRLNLPVGDFSEIEMVTAAQGDEATAAVGSGEDWSYGALGRFHVRGTDVGQLDEALTQIVTAMTELGDESSVGPRS